MFCWNQEVNSTFATNMQCWKSWKYVGNKEHYFQIKGAGKHVVFVVKIQRKLTEICRFESRYDWCLPNGKQIKKKIKMLSEINVEVNFLWTRNLRELLGNNKTSFFSIKNFIEILTVYLLILFNVYPYKFLLRC